MEAKNTIGAMEEGKVTFAIQDFESGCARVEYDTLEEALQNHLHFWEIFNDYENSDNPKQGNGWMSDADDYTTDMLGSWEIVKMVDGEEVSSYSYRYDTTDEAFTADELNQIKEMHKKAYAIVKPRVQRVWFPSELDKEERLGLPIYSVEYEYGNGEEEREIAVQGCTFAEATQYIKENKEFMLGCAIDGGKEARIYYRENDDWVEEDSIGYEEVLFEDIFDLCKFINNVKDYPYDLLQATIKKFGWEDFTKSENDICRDTQGRLLTINDELEAIVIEK